MREIRTPGFVRGAARRGRPYRDWGIPEASLRDLPDRVLASLLIPLLS